MGRGALAGCPAAAIMDGPGPVAYGVRPADPSARAVDCGKTRNVFWSVPAYARRWHAGVPPSYLAPTGRSRASLTTRIRRRHRLPQQQRNHSPTSPFHVACTNHSASGQASPLPCS